MWLKIVLMVFNKSLNEDPRLFTIIHGLLMRRVPFETTRGLSNAWYWRMGRGSQVNPEEEKQRYIQMYFVINVKVPSQPFDDMSVSILMSIPF